MNLSSLLLGFLLVLHLLICGAYGARIGKFSMKTTTNSQVTNNLLQENEDVVKEEHQPQLNDFVNEEKTNDVDCKDNKDDCSSKGKIRKLITSTTMSTSRAKPIQENWNKHGGKKMDIKRDNKAHQIISPPPPPLLFHRTSSMEFDLEKHKENVPSVDYENAMDMTVMDYSPAKRKPPIHN